MRDLEHRVAIKDILERLSDIPEFGEANVSLIGQDAGNVIALIDQAAAECAGPVVLVVVDEIANHSPSKEVTITLNVREHVPTNRENPNHLTAMDTANIAANCLDGETWKFFSARQVSPEDGILEVNATFKGLVG